MAPLPAAAVPVAGVAASTAAAAAAAGRQPPLPLLAGTRGHHAVGLQAADDLWRCVARLAVLGGGSASAEAWPLAMVWLGRWPPPLPPPRPMPRHAYPPLFLPFCLPQTIS